LTASRSKRRHLLLNVRIIDDQLHSGSTIAQECLREMAGMKDQVAKILEGRENGSSHVET
jgi:hypothetical protein